MWNDCRIVLVAFVDNVLGINTSQEKDNVFLLCATNCPWELDIAFLRRFQRRIYIPLPDR